MASIVNTTLYRVSSGVKQRSKNKNRLVLDATGHTLKYSEDGSLRCGIRWMVPYHMRKKNITIQPTKGTLILGEVRERTSAKPNQGDRGFWDKVPCEGGYHLVNRARSYLAIGCNAKMELICVALKDALVWTD
jgi:hypothetical protein